MMRIAAAAALALALAACSEAEDASDLDPAPAAGHSQAPDITHPPGLASLSGPDLETPLPGELRCVFTAAGGSALMIAAANVGAAEPITALVKTGGDVKTLTANTGGYDRMVDGAAYAGDGLTAQLTLQGADTTPGEGLAFPAMLAVEQATGERFEEQGLWSCGP